MPAETPTILLTGEIYVRHDDFSRQFLVEKLADLGFAVKVSGVCEWVYYTDWCYQRNLAGEKPGLRGRVTMGLRTAWMKRQERQLKGIMAASNLSHGRLEDVEHLIHNARHLINPELTGEAILTIGAAVTDVPDPYCGVIAIGPFGCMPNRLSEAILSRAMSARPQSAGMSESGNYGDLPLFAEDLPFIAIESDGNPFPQIITAKLEVFLSQAMRVHGAAASRRRKTA
jgi:predicted nucleotide-binding protein (sugar kinase/HSP70/actin superfamily)